MGAGPSTSQVTQRARLHRDDVLRFLSDVRRGLMPGGENTQARTLLQLSYEDFADFILTLNEQCKDMVDSRGKYLMFAVKKGTADSGLWKATVRIYCLKLLATTGRVESGRCISLQQFLHVRRSVLDVVQERTQHVMTHSGQLHLDIPDELRASVIFNKCEEASNQGDLQSDCTVCMERKPELVLPCAHAYCQICIEKWNVSNQYCPICRDSFRSTDDAWVVTTAPTDEEVTNYLLSVTDSPGPSPCGSQATTR